MIDNARKFFESIHSFDNYTQVGEKSNIYTAFTWEVPTDDLNILYKENEDKDLYFLSWVGKKELGVNAPKRYKARGKHVDQKKLDEVTARAGDEDMVEKKYIYFDFDLIEDGVCSTYEEIPKYADIIKKKLDAHLELKDYRYIIRSGNWLQIYYISELPIGVKWKKNQFSLWAKMMQAVIETVSGYKVDKSCCNLSRIGRLPFSYNNKRKKVLVDVLHQTKFFSEMLEKIIKIGTDKYKEVQKEEKQKVEFEAKWWIYLSQWKWDTFNNIIDKNIPIENEVLKDHNWRQENRNFFEIGSWKMKACWINAEWVLITCWASALPFSDKLAGVGTYAYRKHMSWMSTSQTYEYFLTTYPHLESLKDELEKVQKEEKKVEIVKWLEKNKDEPKKWFVYILSHSKFLDLDLYYNYSEDSDCWPIFKQYQQVCFETWLEWFTHLQSLVQNWVIPTKRNIVYTTKPNKQDLNLLDKNDIIRPSECDWEIHPDIEFLIDNLMNNDSEQIEYMHKAILYKYTHIDDYLMPCFVIKWDQGSGKGLLMLMLMSIFGKRNVNANLSESALTWNFDSVRWNTLVTEFSEVNQGSTKENKWVSNKLKNYIWNPYLSINQKHEKVITMRNLNWFFITSNHINPVALDTHTDNRRYSILKWWQKIPLLRWKEIEKIVRDKDVVAKYMKAIWAKYPDVYNAKWFRTLENSFKQDLVNINKTHTDDFFEWCVENYNGQVWNKKEFFAKIRQYCIKQWLPDEIVRELNLYSWAKKPFRYSAHRDVRFADRGTKKWIKIR